VFIDKELDNLGVGDSVVVAPYYSQNIYSRSIVAEVTKTTKTTFTVDANGKPATFSKSTGKQRGDEYLVLVYKYDFTGRGRRHLMTPEELEAVQAEEAARNHRKQLVRKVAGFRDVDLRNVPNELLQQIIDIVETE